MIKNAILIFFRILLKNNNFYKYLWVIQIFGKKNLRKSTAKKKQMNFFIIFCKKKLRILKST